MEPEDTDVGADPQVVRRRPPREVRPPPHLSDYAVDYLPMAEPHQTHLTQEDVLPSDVQKVIVGEEEQQEWSSSLDQEDPELPHIKEEQEDLWTSQEGEQLQGLEKADITKFTFTPVPVKSEDVDEEKPQSSQLHQRQTEQMETEADGEDCEGPEPARNSDPDRHPEQDTDDEFGNSSEPETDDSNDWKETREPESGLNSLNNDEVPVSDSRCSAGEKPFSCSECDKRFGFKADLKRHMRSHTGEKPFSCSFCVKCFTRSECLLKHMRIHTGEKPFRCSVCGKGFVESGYLKTHMRNHTGEKPFSCSVCKKSFAWRARLRKHMRIHSGEKPFNCSVCEKRFFEKAHLKRHMVTHTGEKPFNCSVCDTIFLTKAHLKSHMITHTGERIFSCSVCNKRFAWRTQVKRHKCVGHQSSQLHQTQTEENREAEPPASSSTAQIKTEADGEDCGGPELARNSDSDRHREPDTDDKTGGSCEPETDNSDDWKETREPQSGLNSLNNEEVPVSDSRCSAGEKPFSCSECGKRYVNKGNLKVHMRSHTGEKPFSCSVCKKSFTRSGDLQKHMRIHTGEKPFSCSVCGKTFTESGNLNTHMRNHTGEKPFSCSVCKKSFARCGHLQKHVRIHTGEKPFSCSVCGKGFNESGYLKTHMRIHTGEKPFRCSFCEKRFLAKVNLKRHMLTHTGEKLFSCSVCDKRFAWRHQVKKHKCVGHQSSQLHQSQTEENREAGPPASSSTVQEELWTSQEGEQLQGLEEADIIKFTFTPVPVKSEDDDGEKLQSSQLHQRQTEQMGTEADGEDCGGPEPARNSEPDKNP